VGVKQLQEFRTQHNPQKIMISINRYGIVNLFVASIIFLYLMSFARYAQAGEFNVAEQNQFIINKDGTISGNFEHADMWMVANALRSSLNLPVCVEEAPLDRDKDGITVTEMIKKLQNAQQTRALTSRESDMLKTCLRLPSVAADSVIEWQTYRTDFVINGLNLHDLLGSIEKNYPQYQIKLYNTYYIITPVSNDALASIKSGPINFDNESFEGILKKLAPLALASGIVLRYSETDSGPVSDTHSVAGKPDFLQSKITLKMLDPTWEELATALAQATTPKIVWSGGRVSETLVITFTAM
jgi:hypothetical protein